MTDERKANPPASDVLAEMRQLRTEMVQLFAQVLAALETKGGENA